MSAVIGRIGIGIGLSQTVDLGTKECRQDNKKPPKYVFSAL